jgi:hypothetical protein
MKGIFFTLAVISASCDESDTNRDSIEYFQCHLKSDMNYKKLTFIFGEPDSDIGSGIHIYVYNLDDGTKVYVGYTDKILYARHFDQNDQLLEELI